MRYGQRQMKQIDVMLWGGRYDGSVGKVAMYPGVLPTEIIEWPDGIEPPAPTCILGENLDVQLADPVRYRLDWDHHGAYLLYRLEKIGKRVGTE